MISAAKLTVHPAAEIFPPMDDIEFQELKNDISKSGQLEPIVTYENQILDGRHRYRACTELGMEARQQEYEGEDPVKFVLSKNLHRRHLNESGRAMIAARLADLKQGGDRSKAQNCGLTHAQAAKLLNVSERQVDHASALLNARAENRVIPEVVESVHNGAIRLNRAMKIARLTPEQQRESMCHARDRRVGRAPAGKRRREWTSRFEMTVRQLEHWCNRMMALATDARKAGALTPARKRRLLDTLRDGERRLADTAGHLERIPQDSELMPEVIDEPLANLDQQAS